MYTEWIELSPDMPVRQGDLLLARDPNSGRISRTCLVITADCDIGQQKSGSHLSCLSVIYFHEYIRSVWAERKLRRTLDNETEKIRVQLNKWNAQRIGTDSALTADGVLYWVRNKEPTTICADLRIPKEDISKVISVVSVFRSALAASEERSSDHALARLVAFRATLSSKTGTECLAEITNQAQGDDLPDDVFLLPYIPQLEDGPAVIMLREIVTIPIATVCYRTLDADSEAKHLRIGRLEPTLKYAVSQAFGALYSRIGLSRDYEQHCKVSKAKMRSLS